MHRKVYLTRNSSSRVERDHSELCSRQRARSGRQQTCTRVDADVRNRSRVGAPSNGICDIELLSICGGGGDKLFTASISNTAEPICRSHLNRSDAAESHGYRGAAIYSSMSASNCGLPWRYSFH